MEKMAVVMASFIPTSLGRFLPIIIGVLSVPLALLFDTDSYFYACCPFWSASATSSASTRLTSPSQWSSAATALPSSAVASRLPTLAIGLAGVEIKDHIKYCFGWQWGVSIICLVAGLILGVIHF